MRVVFFFFVLLCLAVLAAKTGGSRRGGAAAAELSDDPIDDNELDGSAAHGDGDGHESEDSVPAPQRRTGRVKRSLNLNMDLADDNDADDIEDDTEELRAAL